MSTIPSEMDAWVLRPDRHGAPETAFRLERVPVPEPGEREVLVRVMAAGLNYSGVFAALGKPVSPFVWHGAEGHIPGSDGAGIVVKLGPGVTRARVGDEIVVQPNRNCRKCPSCLKGVDDLCDRYQILGYETPGGTFAQYTVLQESQLYPKPPHLTWEEAGSYLVSLLTAYHMLVDRAQLRKTDDVLVWGAAGGMGVYGIQLARLFGHRAVAIVSSPERAELVKKLGAHAVLNRLEHPGIFNVHKRHGDERKAGLQALKRFREEIRSSLGGKKDVDVVFEHVGEATFFASVYVAAENGRVVLSGATTGYDLTFDARYLWISRKSIIGAHSAPLAQCRKAHDLIAERKIDVVLTQTFPFAEVAGANQLMHDAKLSGNCTCLIDAPGPGLGRSA